MVGACEYLPFGTERFDPMVCHDPEAFVRNVRFIKWFCDCVTVIESGGFRGCPMVWFCGDSEVRRGVSGGRLR
jgi:hypothetical protein